MDFRFAGRLFTVLAGLLICLSSYGVWAGENDHTVSNATQSANLSSILLSGTYQGPGGPVPSGVRSQAARFEHLPPLGMFQGSEPSIITPNATQAAEVSLKGMNATYYGGDTFSIKVVVSGSSKGEADLYVAAAIYGQPSLLFFTGDDRSPFSGTPVPAKSGISITSETYSIFSLPLPTNVKGLGFYIYAVLLESGKTISKDAFISNVAIQSVKFVETPQDADDQKQANAFRGVEKIIGVSSLDGRLNQGVVRKLEMGIPLEKSGLPAGTTLDDAALGFMTGMADLLRVSTPMKNLRLFKRSGDEKSRRYHFTQYYKDIPVYGAWFKMVLKDEKSQFVLQRIAGRYSPNVSLTSITPEVSEKKARIAILKSEGLSSLSELEVLAPLKLWIFDEALLAPECAKCSAVEHNPRLAWRIVYNSPEAHGAATDVFVDALLGDILFNLPRTDGELQLNSFTAEGNTSSTCFAWQATRRTEWHDEEGECDYSRHCSYSNYCPLEGFACVSPTAEGYDNFDWSLDLYAFYRDVFGRRSYDGDDSYIWMYLNVGFSPANASSTDCGAWNIHQFSTGMHTIDVVGHEFGHSVHDSETNFVYQNESGAVAEHIADMFGHFFACWVGVDCDWMQGEDTVRADAAGCGRDFSDPRRCGDPDHFADYFVTSNDHGGVHTNNGILNKAGFLLTDGGTHQSVTVLGIGEERARQVYYRAVTHEMGRNTGFNDFASDMADACSDLISDGTVTSNDCCQVRNAFAAVGLGLADQDCDGVPNDTDTDDDDDLVPDATDNCILVPNPSQTDTDSDGLGNACDPDDDNDLISDDVDNCPIRANAGQQDIDGDGVGDACDDADGDGVRDDVDNCRTHHNRDQADTNGDGEGDVCDSDIDGDGVANTSDNCDYHVNAAQADGDGDGVGDACDNCLIVANADQEDLNGDGEGNECDDDDDGDGIPDNRDNCPEEYTSMGEWSICPEGAFCEWGCDPVWAITPDPASARWRFGLEELDPLHPSAMHPAMTIPFDPCDFVPCEAQSLFGEETFVNVTLNMLLDLSGEEQARQGMLFHVAVVDEAGHRFGEGVVIFDNNQLEPNAEETGEKVVMSFPIRPSYTWRESGKFSYAEQSDAALPSYYLIVPAALAGEEQQKILSKLPLDMSVHVSVGQAIK